MREHPHRSALRVLWRRNHLNTLDSPRIGLSRRHCLVAATVVVAAFLACSGSDTGHSQPVLPGVTNAVADDPPSGFATLVLTPADPLPSLAQPGANAPIGTVWYHVGGPAVAPTGPLDWYVRAHHLLPDRIYRVEMTVDGHATYSVGRARSDDNGTFTVHGTLSRFADQYCVGDPAAPQPVSGEHQIGISVKRDGSGAGAAAGGALLTDPTRALPCGGNGDGVFDYWLVAPNVIRIGPAHGQNDEPATTTQ
jgi:hypothetical protein